MSDHTRIPILSDDKFFFLKGRSIVWLGDGLATINTFQVGAGRILFEIMERHGNTKTVVVDCSGLYSLGDHAFSAVSNLLVRKHTDLILFNADGILDEVRQSMPDVHFEHIKDTHGKRYGIFKGRNSTDHHELNEITARMEKVCANYLDLCLKDCYRPFAGASDPEPDPMNERGERKMQSTPLLARGVYNARALISDPTKFLFVATSLAEAVKDIVTTVKPAKSHSLLSVSLRSSPFAAAVGTILGMPFEIVDHMGPRMKILEEYTFDIGNFSDSYIYVGDFCIGGSELKIAETYSIVKGIELCGAAVIGSVLDLSSPDKGFPFRRLADLHKLHPENEYRLI